MAEFARIITSPLAPAGGLSLADLTVVVSADALRRWGASHGREPEVLVPSVSGDLAAQQAADRDLAREGLDRSTASSGLFAERVKSLEAAAWEDTERALARLAVPARPGAGVDAGQAARTAFVRLFEEGALEAAERVVSICSHCRAVVDDADAVAEDMDGMRLVLSLPFDDGEGALRIEVAAPELLPGAVGVLVPDDDPGAGRAVVVPLAERSVPVVAGGVERAEVLVPAHDGDALEVTRRLGLLPVDVFGADGVVHAPGPLEGLSRFAARAAAGDLLKAEGLVVEARPVAGREPRCPRCGTVLLPRLGRHWFLARGELERAAADLLREGAVEFSPPTLRDELVAAAGQRDTWCVSGPAGLGEPLPVSACLDCGGTAVAVEPPESCGKCMGTLVPDGAVLDPRFVAAMWPLAATGWPSATDEGGLAGPVLCLVTATPFGGWLPAASALAIRLTGSPPFDHVAVVAPAATGPAATGPAATGPAATGPAATGPTATGATSPAAQGASGSQDPSEATPDLASLGAEAGLAATRLALLAGSLDVDAAAPLAAAIDNPPVGDADPAAIVDACDGSLAAGLPAAAVASLEAGLFQGVAAGSAALIQRVAAPLVGR